MRIKARLKRKKSAKDKVRRIKTNLRMYSASDVIWMLQCDEHRDCKVVESDVGLWGLSVKIENGVSTDGMITYSSQEWGWKSVAIALGFDEAEPVLDQNGIWNVLLYNIEKYR